MNALRPRRSPRSRSAWPALLAVGVALAPSAWANAPLGGTVVSPASIAASAGASVSASVGAAVALPDRLDVIRARVLAMQDSLLSGIKGQHQARENVRRIRALLQLQREERALGQKRLAQLEGTVQSLDQRRTELRGRIAEQQAAIHRLLVAIDRSAHDDAGLPGERREVIEAPRRKLLGNLVNRGLREIEALRADVSDAEHIEGRIQEERQQLAYLFQELGEQAGVLELNRRLQVDLLRRHREERVGQLEHYRQLKTSEAQVEKLIGEFNARRELERTLETERHALSTRVKGEFADLRGTLPLPVADGRIVSAYGKAFDARSQLYVFKKGIDIAPPGTWPTGAVASASAGAASVRAISAGRVVFAGELPQYGRVAIVDHGGHYYSLCGRLGELGKRSGDPVAAGDELGKSDAHGGPVYFEIRARNLAVNPLQWITARASGLAAGG